MGDPGKAFHEPSQAQTFGVTQIGWSMAQPAMTAVLPLPATLVRRTRSKVGPSSSTTQSRPLSDRQTTPPRWFVPTAMRPRSVAARPVISFGATAVAHDGPAVTGGAEPPGVGDG